MPQPNEAARPSAVVGAPLPKRVLTIREYQSAYGPGRTKTYELIKARKLKTVRYGNRRFITTDSAEALHAESAA